MRISDLINEDNIEIAAELSTKDEALERLIALHKQTGGVKDPKTFGEDIRKREQEGSTAMAGRIAIPYAVSRGAKHPALTAVTVKDGVEFGAPDKRPVRLIFMIAGDDGTEEYLSLRTRLQRLLLDSAFTARLSAAKTADEFLTLLSEREERRFPSKKAMPKTVKNDPIIPNKKNKNILSLIKIKLRQKG